MTSSLDRTLTLGESVDLVHALVGREADRLGVRALAIKGPASRAQGLRLAGVSNDVDFLVEPGRFQELVSALEHRGWAPLDAYRGPHLLPAAGLTLFHPAWRCTIDLHDRFPGLFRSPDVLFERLWSGHDEVHLAHQRLAAPRADRHALLLAVNSLRSGVNARPAVELLASRCREVLEPSAIRGLGEEAHRLGAADTAAAFVDELAAVPVGRGSTSEADWQAWKLLTGAAANLTSVAWVDQLMRTTWRRWPGLLVDLVSVDRAVLAASLGRRPTRAELWRHRRARYGRGVRALPHAVRAWRQSRR